MNNSRIPDTREERLRHFAQIYTAKMAERPFMEIIARYQSMTEAGLLTKERETADLFIETQRLNDLLYPPQFKVVSKT